MNNYSSAIVYIITIFSNIFLLFLVISRTIYPKLKWFFCLFVLSILGWIVSLYFYYQIDSSDMVLIIGRLNYAIAALIPVFMIRFVSLFPDDKENSSNWVNLFLYFEGISVFTLMFTPLMIDRELIMGASRETQYGVLFPIFIIHFIGLIIYSIYLLIQKYKKATSIAKLQLKYLIFGSVTASIVGILTNIVIPYFTKYTDVQTLGPLSTLFLIGFTTYSIVKHRLFDIRLAFRLIIIKTATFIFICSILFITGLVLIKSRLNIPESTLLLSALIVGTFYIFSYEAIERFVKRLSDIYIFKKELTKNELLSNFGKSISKNIRLDELILNITQILKDSLDVKNVRFDFDANTNTQIKKYFIDRHDLIFIDDLKRQRINKHSEDNLLTELIDKLVGEEVSVIIPLTTSEGVSGLIFISEKRDNSAYTSNDLEALEALTYQLNVAVENALLFEEVQQFNKKLQAEVAAATTDLKIRNKRLTILRQLDQIVINTPDVRDMTQKIADLISWEMGFIGASIILLDEDEAGKYLHIVALSDTPTYERALKLLPQPITDYRINWGLDPSNLFYKCINERKAYYTDTFKNMYVPPLTIQQAEELQKATKTEHTVIYPLSTKGNALGAIAFSVHQQFDELSNDDKELISAFMDEAGIAIENTQLYTKLEKTNQSLTNANERLKQLDKMKDELVSVASHELRTPMTAIKSYLWMALNKEAPNLTTNMRRYLERAFISSERMIELVNDMLSASRLEGGRIELDLQAYDLVPIIGDVIDQMMPKAQEKNLDLIFEKPTIDVPLGYIDEARFREIMFNLVGNSVKYTNEGSVKVAVSVNTKPSEDEESAISNRNYIWITISDTGRGIPAEDMPRLFKKFSKLEQGSFAKTAETGGTGLGLYITKGLVELHGGRIWVHSTGDNQGSVFTFSVKVA